MSNFFGPREEYDSTRGEGSMREIWDFCRDNHLKATESRQRDIETRLSRGFIVGDRVALKTLSGPKFISRLVFA